jgi:Family of unknown function (DUF5647)
MTRDEVVRRNLDLLNEFMQVAFEKPEILDQIPPDAELIILPENDPELYTENQATLAGLRQQSKRCVVVHMYIPERVAPRIEVMAERG